MGDNKYPVEDLGDDEDDGTMPDNVQELRDIVVGHRIISAEKGKAKVGPNDWRGERSGLIVTLDNGVRALIEDTDDCCAYTVLEAFLLHPNMVDHIITGIGTTDGYEKWHIYADMGDVMELTVGWSSGNPFYYAYGFAINVLPIDGEIIPTMPALRIY